MRIAAALIVVLGCGSGRGRQEAPPAPKAAAAPSADACAAAVTRLLASRGVAYRDLPEATRRELVADCRAQADPAVVRCLARAPDGGVPSCR